MNKDEVNDKLGYAQDLFFVMMRSGQDFVNESEDGDSYCYASKNRARFSRLRKELNKVLLEIDNEYFYGN